MSYTVLLYYKFVVIADPEASWKKQQKLCRELNLKGRVLIGAEGINGTVAGTESEIVAYKKAVWADPYFQDLQFKESEALENPFPKLKVKLRKEIISVHEEVDLKEARGEYISPSQLEDLYASEQEFYLFDARNKYESVEGAFRHAITPEIDHFRDLPEMVEEYKELKNKKVVMYCTGGIRCEKATALFKSHGFKQVYQLEGGIVNYIVQYPNRNFEGDCYVFDNRMRLTQDELAKHGAISQPPQSLKPQ